jgi:hypothetical protein
MKTRALAWLLVAIEALLLGVFLFAARKAASLVPGATRGGDVELMGLWNGRAGLAFWSLALIWVAAVLVTFTRPREVETTGRLRFREKVQGVFALATLLPLFGLVGEYLSGAIL